MEELLVVSCLLSMSILVVRVDGKFVGIIKKLLYVSIFLQ